MQEIGKKYFAVVDIKNKKGRCFAAKGNPLTLLHKSGELVIVSNGMEKFSIQNHLISQCPVLQQQEAII